MKSIKTLFLVLTCVLISSCTAETPLPTSGENSFFARLNGEKYIPKDFSRIPYPTSHGLQAVKEDSIWHIRVDNRSNKLIHIFLNDVDQPGDYLIQNIEQEYPHQFPQKTPTSIFITESIQNFYLPKEGEGPDYIKITAVEDSLIIGEFQKITLTDPENPANTDILTNGRFHINLATLNKN